MDLCSLQLVVEQIIYIYLRMIASLIPTISEIKLPHLTFFCVAHYSLSMQLLFAIFYSIKTLLSCRLLHCVLEITSCAYCDVLSLLYPLGSVSPHDAA